MTRPAALLLLLAACAPAPEDPERLAERETERLVRALESADDRGTEDRAVALGGRAVPALARVVRHSPSGDGRRRAARALGRIHRGTGARLAMEAYLDALDGAPEGWIATALLAEAHWFPDPEGRVMRHLLVALGWPRGITAEIVLSAAALTDAEAFEAMAVYIARNLRADAPGIEDAFRYVGRAARRGRVNALDFLSKLADEKTDVARLAQRELHLAAGKITVRNWRGWYLANAKRRRSEHLAEAFAYSFGGAFDPVDRLHVAKLIDSMSADEELEPEFALLEALLGRRFGYVSPRDVFDPAIAADDLARANARALDTLKAWWRENAPYAWYDASMARWAINEEARAASTPVDPKTGHPQ